MLRAAIVALSLSAGLGSAQLSSAQEPSGDVTRIVVPYAPGGSTDVIARLLAQEFAAVTQQKTIVENRPGAAGAIGAEYVVRSRPDGRTILIGTSTLTVDPSFRTLPFKVVDDLAAVTDVGTMAFAVIGSGKSNVRTFKDLLGLIREKPGEVNYATSGVGSTNHLTAELIRLNGNLDYHHIPYSGSGPAAQAAVTNTVQFIVDPVGPHAGLIESGDLRVLAVTGAARSKVMPDIPTVAESGIPNVDVSVFVGLFVSRQTPPELVEKLNKILSTAIKSPPISNRLRDMGIEPGGSSAATFSDRVRRDTAQWGKVIADAKIPTTKAK